MLIWGKTGLSDGPHTVTITHMGVADKYVNVDFLKYLPRFVHPICVWGEPYSDRPPNYNSSASSSSNTPSRANPVGAIVGGVIGGVAFIALIAGIAIWRWRRRSTQDATTSEHGTYVSDVTDDVKKSYDQSPPETPGLVPAMNDQKVGL